MTDIDIRRDGKTAVFILSGHADFGNPDILCSAISVTTYMLAEMHNTDGTLLDYRKGAGLAEIRARDDTERAKTLNDAAETSFRALAANYPKNIVIHGA